MLSWYVAQVLSGIIIIIIIVVVVAVVVAAVAAAAAVVVVIIVIVVPVYVRPYSYIVTLELSIKISQYIECNTQT